MATWTRLIPKTPANLSGLKPCQVSHLIPNFHPNEFLSWYHPVSFREQRRGCRFSRETLSSENKSSQLSASKPGALAQETSPGDPEPLSGGPLVDSPQDETVEAVNDYDTLVLHGKELKECGKIQEALDCLVKALDIKSSDPEVMLMTLSLYKQLNKT